MDEKGDWQVCIYSVRALEREFNVRRLNGTADEASSRSQSLNSHLLVLSRLRLFIAPFHRRRG